MTELDRTSLDAFTERHRARFEADLRTLVEIPSVSADPAHTQDMRRCAEAARDILAEAGAEAEILETSGQPMVFGRIGQEPSFPTILIYNHLDVQAANEPAWRTDPFELVIDDDIYRGRGTTDNKGPALTALLGALAAREAGVEVNIKFLWELEEEIGSPGFYSAVEKHEDLLTTDSVLVSDTIWLAHGQPSTPAGLRGMQAFTLSLETGDHDVHSGLVSGAARNPLAELMTLIGEMFDGRTGHVKIPGFYDDVEDLTVAECLEFARSGFKLDSFIGTHNLYSLRSDDPLDVMARTWAQPTMEIHGVTGGYSGPGIKAWVPGRAEVKMSCRLVPNQRAEDILHRVAAFVAERAPEVKLVPDIRIEPYKGRTSGPYADALREAYRFGFHEKPAFTREPGSIGAVWVMEELLGAEIYFLGLSLPSHHYHAPNENYDWGQVQGGAPAFARYLEQCSLIHRR